MFWVFIDIFCVDVLFLVKVCFRGVRLLLFIFSLVMRRYLVLFGVSIELSYFEVIGIGKVFIILICFFRNRDG